MRIQQKELMHNSEFRFPLLKYTAFLAIHDLSAALKMVTFLDSSRISYWQKLLSGAVRGMS